MKKWSDRWLIKQCKKLGLRYCFVKIGENGAVCEVEKIGEDPS